MAKNSLKKSLMMSAAALSVCGVMLVGTTYAWFTSSVSSNRNTIASGNLDVALEYASEFNPDGTVKTWDTVDETVKLFSEESLWEPGHTEAAYLKVTNRGSLALKYQLAVNVLSEVEGTNVKGEKFKLSDYLVFAQAVSEEAPTELDRKGAQALGDEMGLGSYLQANKLLPATEEAESADYVTLVVYMPTTVGNEANHQTGTVAPKIDLGVNLYATQAVEEEDAFGNDYDADAEWFRISNSFDSQEEVEKMFAPKEDTPSGIVVEDGVGRIERNGAWHTMSADLANYIYTVEYDIEVTAGKIKFDAGYNTTWFHKFVELEESAHVTYTFYVVDGKTAIEYNIAYESGETDKGVSYDSKGVSALYWNIYEFTGAATIDNFAIYAVSAPDFYTSTVEGLQSAIKEAKEGDVIGIAGDIVVDTTTPVPDGVTIDGYGNMIKRNPHIDGSAVFKLQGAKNVTIKNITIGGEDFAGVLIYEDTVNNILIENVTFEDKACIYLQYGVKNVTIRNCTFNAEYGVQVDESGRSMENLIIENNTFNGSKLAFYSSNGKLWENFNDERNLIVVKGNKFTGAFAALVEFHGGYESEKDREAIETNNVFQG